MNLPVQVVKKTWNPNYTATHTLTYRFDGINKAEKMFYKLLRKVQDDKDRTHIIDLSIIENGKVRVYRSIGPNKEVKYLSKTDIIKR